MKKRLVWKFCLSVAFYTSIPNVLFSARLNLFSTHTMSFTNKVVIVIGSSSGIGAATSVTFSTEGAEAIIVGRNALKLVKLLL